MAKKLSILILTTICFAFFACNKKNNLEKALPVGTTIHLFENESKESSDEESVQRKEYKIGDLIFSFEKIDKDRYEVEKVKQKFPSSLIISQLPQNIISKIGIGENGLMKSIQFENGTIKYFPIKKNGEDQYHFYAYYPQLKMVSVSTISDNQDVEITSYDMKTGHTSDILPEDYSPDGAYCFTIKEDSTNLSALAIDIKRQKKIATFMLDDIESGYSPGSYESEWIGNDSALLKVEANNQDEDEYWILTIKK